MKYNEKIATEYGFFMEAMGESPKPYKPVVTKSDYAAGSITRVFAKKFNDNRIIEISMEQINRLNTDLYKTVMIKWKVSGPRENRTIDGVVEYGVKEMNRFEIERAKKEQLVDLSSVVTNMLEYWQDH
jgi:hypothetical protein